MKSKQVVTNTAKKMKKDKYFKRRKVEILTQGITIRQLALEMGKNEQTVRTVVNYYPVKKSRSIQEYIAKRLNVPYEDLWNNSRGNHSKTITNKKRHVND